MAVQTNQIAEALRQTLISPNVVDDNLEPANLVDVLNHVANALLAVAKAIEAANAK